MRTILTVAFLTAALVGLPFMRTFAADAAAVAPAANVSFLAQAGTLATQLASQATSALGTAKKAADLPFAGEALKSKVAAAQTKVDAATELQHEVDGLAHGQAPASTGILSQIAGGSGPSLADRFKGLPLASTVQTVLGNKDLVGALLAAAPVDKIPGYALAEQALAALPK